MLVIVSVVLFVVALAALVDVVFAFANAARASSKSSFTFNNSSCLAFSETAAS